MRGTVEERFWAKVDTSGGPEACWLWTRTTHKWDYGNFAVGKKTVKAHRFSWILAHGEIPTKTPYILHNCPTGDNPACCNPTHLWLGTQADNIADMRAKGREAAGEARHAPRGAAHGSQTHPEQWRHGEENGKAKLTDADVEAIRTRYAAGGISQAKLGALFHVHQTQISHIVRGVQRKGAR